MVMSANGGRIKTQPDAITAAYGAKDSNIDYLARLQQERVSNNNGGGLHGGLDGALISKTFSSYNTGGY